MNGPFGSGGFAAERSPAQRQWRQPLYPISGESSVARFRCRYGGADIRGSAEPRQCPLEENRAKASMPIPLVDNLKHILAGLHGVTIT